MTEPFVHLHVHTQYSLLEGAIRIKALPGALKERGMEACAITDLGNLFGAIEFYETLRGAGLKPIIGLAAQVADGSRNKRDYPRPGPNASQVLLLCQNREGYLNLSKLASLAYLEGKHYLPRIDRELLEKHQQGIIALSGGEWGVLGRPLKLEGLEAAREAARWFGQVFEGRFYVEVQNQGAPWEAEAMPQLLELAKTLQLPLAGANECYYLHPDEGEAQFLLHLIGRQRNIKDADTGKFTDLNRFLRSSAEMQTALAAFPQAYLNPGRIAAQCDLDLTNKTYHLPQCDTPPGLSEDCASAPRIHPGAGAPLKHLASALWLGSRSPGRAPPGLSKPLAV